MQHRSSPVQIPDYLNCMHVVYVAYSAGRHTWSISSADHEDPAHVVLYFCFEVLCMFCCMGNN